MNKKQFLFAIIIIVFLVIIIFYFCVEAKIIVPNVEQYMKDNNINCIDKTKIIDLLDDCDLIFLSGNTHGERICKIMGKSIFSHVGMILKDENSIYIIECDVGQQYKRGVRVIPFSTKLERYKGDNIGAIRKYTGNKDNINDIKSNLNKYMSFEFDDLMLSWVFSDITLLRKIVKQKNKVFCSEFIALLLKNMGKIKENEVIQSFHPKDFLNERVSHIYGNIIFFRF